MLRYAMAMLLMLGVGLAVMFFWGLTTAAPVVVTVPPGPAPMGPPATEPATESIASERADATIEVDDDDPEMVAAVAKARRTLPEFWAIFAKPQRGETDFELKVKIADENGTEYFWVTQIERAGGKIFGVIDDEPDTVKCVKLGQRVEVREADIADWQYKIDGKIYGNVTLRAMFHLMTPEEVAKDKAMFAQP
ncbi:MAG: DUF2314 domain-containing protein [Planctomycetota bacterium]|nr:DUF2314 domain-containing protein [Planctomycetota bacterium]